MLGSEGEVVNAGSLPPCFRQLVQVGCRHHLPLLPAPPVLDLAAVEAAPAAHLGGKLHLLSSSWHVSHMCVSASHACRT